MDADRYCRERVAQSGSSLYYALLYAEPEQRLAVTALHALRRELDDIVLECADRGVALAKIAWWHDELERALHREARHPVGRAVAVAVAKHSLAGDDVRLIVAKAAGAMQHPARDAPELEAQCRNGAGTICRLTAQIFGYRDERTLPAAVELGVGLQMSEWALDANARSATRSAVDGPLQSPGAATAAAVTDLDHHARNVYASRARHFLEGYERELPVCDRAPQRSNLTLVAIHLAALRVLQRSSRAGHEQRTTITPLRKLWIAWRMRHSIGQ